MCFAAAALVHIANSRADETHLARDLADQHGSRVSISVGVNASDACLRRESRVNCVGRTVV